MSSLSWMFYMYINFYFVLWVYGGRSTSLFCNGLRDFGGYIGRNKTMGDSKCQDLNT